MVDDEDPDAVAGLLHRIDTERGRLDVLVNDIFGGDRYMQWDEPLWEHGLAGGLRMLQMGVWTHLVTSHHADSAHAAYRGPARNSARSSSR